MRRGIPSWKKILDSLRWHQRGVEGRAPRLTFVVPTLQCPCNPRELSFRDEEIAKRKRRGRGKRRERGGRRKEVKG